MTNDKTAGSINLTPSPGVYIQIMNPVGYVQPVEPNRLRAWARTVLAVAIKLMRPENVKGRKFFKRRIRHARDNGWDIMSWGIYVLTLDQAQGIVDAFPSDGSDGT